MMYRLKITAKAKKELKTLQELYHDAVLTAFYELTEDPFIGKQLDRELKGKLSYKIDVYRIVYIINEKDKIVTIVTAGHRSTVYKKG